LYNLLQMKCSWCNSEVFPKEHKFIVFEFLNDTQIQEYHFHANCYFKFEKNSESKQKIMGDKHAIIKSTA